MKRKSILVLILLLLFATVVTGCGTDGKTAVQGGPGEPSNVKAFQPAEKAPIYPETDNKTFKFLTIASALPYPQDYFMFEKGLLAEETKNSGYKFQEIYDGVHQKVLPNLYNGYFDFGYATTSVMTEYWSGKVLCNPELWQRGDQYVIVAGSDIGLSPLLLAPGVNGLKDLDGKTYGIINPAFQYEYEMNKMLQTVGLKTKAMGGTVDIHFDYATNIVNEKVMREKKIAAAKIWQPYANMLKGKGWKQVKVQPSLRALLIVRRDILEKHPDLVKQVIKAHVKATDTALKDTSYIAGLIEKYNTKYLPVLDQTPRPAVAFPFKTLKLTYDPNLQFLKATYDYMAEAKHFKKEVKFDQVVDLTLLNEVLKEMGQKEIK